MRTLRQAERRTGTCGMRRPRPQTQPRSPRLSPRKGEEQSPSNDLGRYFGTGVSLGHRRSGLKRSRILQGRETNKPTIQKKHKQKQSSKETKNNCNAARSSQNVFKVASSGIKCSLVPGPACPPRPGTRPALSGLGNAEKPAAPTDRPQAGWGTSQVRQKEDLPAGSVSPV